METNKQLEPGSSVQFDEKQESQSVGEEFIKWAEKYWLLDQIIKIDQPDSFAGELCTYNYMRGVFIKKINAIIEERLGIFQPSQIITTKPNKS